MRRSVWGVRKGGQRQTERCNGHSGKTVSSLWGVYTVIYEEDDGFVMR